MKKLLYIFFILFHCSLNAQFRDSREPTKFFQKVNFGFVWAEIGRSIPLQQKKISTLDNGLDLYMKDIQGEMFFGSLGLSITYKNKFGIEGLICYYSAGSQDNEFNSYLAEKYPNHYIPKGFRYSYSIGNVGLRLFYRKNFKHFFIEPKFQICFNGFENNYSSFRMKEMGSNQYIQYSIEHEILGLKNSYHLMFIVAKSFTLHDLGVKFMVGLSGELMICPIRETVTITEQPYGMPAISNQQTFSLYYPTFTPALSLRAYFMNRTDREGIYN